MKSVWMTCLMTALLVGQVAMAQPEQAAPRKKVAVVLSGGGAKGVGHVGALKVIERAGVPIDIITGTSMGSIVGGLYAIGYHADALDSIVRHQDWNALILDREDLSRQSIEERQRQNSYIISTGLSFSKDRRLKGGGIIRGKNLHSLFERLVAGYSDSIDFNTLPIPFACVATNLVDFTEYDFHSGYLAQAMRASMAIPAVFTPVRIDSMVLVDGGMRNNYPADLARQMGADIIIGISVTDNPIPADELDKPSNILMQILDINTKNKYQENLAITDVMIKVDTKGYTAASFTSQALDTLLRRGEEAAMAHWDELAQVRQRLGLSQAAVNVASGSRHNPAFPAITNVEFTNIGSFDEKYIRSKFHLHQGDTIDTRRIEQMLTAMRSVLFYQDPTYHLTKTDGGMKAIVNAGPKKTTQLNLGVRFDTEEMVALQVNGNFPLRKSVLPDVDLTLRLGMRIMARLDLTFYPGRLLRPTLSYAFHRDEINIYEQGDKDYNFTYNQHAVELSLLNFNVRNFNVVAGLRWDNYHFPHVLRGEQTHHTIGDLDNGHYYSYYARVNYNSEDNWYFPSRGSKLNAQFAYYTDNFARLNDQPGLSDVSVMWRMSMPFSHRFTLQPMLYGRLLFGEERPAILSNLIGGEWFGHRVFQQQPFAGVNYLEHVDPFFVAMQLQAQQRFGRNHYFLLRAAVGQQAMEIGELLDSRTLLGGSFSYYYDAVFGPLGASVGYSNKTKQPYFYINLGYVF